MAEEGKVSSTLGWFRTAKDKFRAFAYGEQNERRERPRVGLALAGGFARGIAHLGVLRVLREAGIPIDCVAGTSVGALSPWATVPEHPWKKWPRLEPPRASRISAAGRHPGSDWLPTNAWKNISRVLLLSRRSRNC